MIIICPSCNKEAFRKSGHVNRARKIGAPVYCDRACAGVGRRKYKSIEEKKRVKADYDAMYRKANEEKLKADKQRQHKLTYDPIKAAEERKKRMPAHIEYCRRPEYKVWKKGYDEKYRAEKTYGEYSESFLIIKEIEKQYSQREVRQINNLHNKTQNRKAKWMKK